MVLKCADVIGPNMDNHFFIFKYIKWVEGTLNVTSFSFKGDAYSAVAFTETYTAKNYLTRLYLLFYSNDFTESHVS